MDPCPDHTKGTGSMMIVNGAPETGVSVWTSEPMTVTPNTNYLFLVWIESVDDINPASLQFSINGTPLGDPVNASALSCNWNRFYTIWNSGDNRTATISLINNNTIRFGNDFALDDISFAPMTMQSDSLAITVDSLPRITAGKSNDIDCAVHFTRLSADGGVSYSWTPADDVDDPFSANPTASVDHTTLFTVRGAGNNGCIGADSIIVGVTATGANTFVVPNAFSPNADGHNDCFGIDHWGNVQLEQMQIYNRGGMLVFSTRDPSRCWDGTFRGKPQPAGAYAFIIKAHTACGEIIRKGAVTLLR
jgi:gliding motility-associated-like protein